MDGTWSGWVELGSFWYIKDFTSTSLKDSQSSENGSLSSDFVQKRKFPIGQICSSMQALDTPRGVWASSMVARSDAGIKLNILKKVPSAKDSPYWRSA